MPDSTYQVVVIGAGPTGLACAIDAQKVGLRTLVIDKGCLVNSLYNYPANMTFFTTSELLEIGDIPFPSPHAKPTRMEALEYYRKVAQHYNLHVRQYERVDRVSGNDGAFRISTTDQYGREQLIETEKIIVATGYYDLPNMMNIPGEHLAKVMHYYREPHPYWDQNVLIIGGKNSAAIAALELWRHGARVTIVHRNAAMHRNVKYWILPDIENRIKNGEITAYFESKVLEVAEDSVLLKTPSSERRIANDWVFALTGYRPDFSFIQSLGIQLGKVEKRPVCDPQTLESNVAGIYLAGVVVAGTRTSEIFIENGRFHGGQIARDLAAKMGRSRVHS